MMAEYKITQNGVFRRSDNAGIPADINNSDWQKYLEWLNQGNTPDPQFTLDDLKAQKIADLQDTYQSAIFTNVTYTSKSQITKNYQNDANSQQVLLQTTIGYGIAGRTPNSFYWLADDNTPVMFELSDLQGLYQTMLENGQNAFIKYQTLKAQAKQANDESTLNAINWD